MTVQELQAIAASLGPVIKDVIGKSNADRDAEIASLKAQIASLQLQHARDGVDGKDADPSIVAQIVKSQIQTDLSDMESRLAETARKGIQKAIAELPVPMAGERGEKGDQGPIGEMGPQGPAGRDGRDGQAGLPGVQGDKGLDGLNGKDGRDGIDGKDGLGFDDMDGEYDEHGRLSLKFVRGDIAKMYRVPGIVDRGIWREGETYENGDAVTWGGSFFIAQCQTSAKPETSKDWRLAAKRGRDGKNGIDGKAGPQGPKGKEWSDR